MANCRLGLQFVDIGVVTSIEMNHKSVDSAKKGQEVCVKIEPIPGESPKMYGRHFEATDIIVSKVRTRPPLCSQKHLVLFSFTPPCFCGWLTVCCCHCDRSLEPPSTP